MWGGLWLDSKVLRVSSHRKDSVIPGHTLIWSNAGVAAGTMIGFKGFVVFFWLDTVVYPLGQRRVCLVWFGPFKSRSGSLWVSLSDKINR